MLVIDEDRVLEFEKDANLETIRCYSPKMADHIEYSWGYPECMEYMRALMKQVLSVRAKIAVYKLIEIHGKV